MSVFLAENRLVDNADARSEHVIRELYSPASMLDESRNISKKILAELRQTFDFALPLEMADMELSPTDGSVKLAVRLLRDGLLVETVLVPERNRLTQCISTQVGCAQGCAFCHTGHMGLSRGLSVDEMVGQVVLGERVRRRHPVLRDSPLARYDRVSNVVYMGMGEPLDNLEAVLGSLVLFFDDKGFRLSPNKVTVSTVGLMPALAELLAQSPVSVALSLHSPFDEERSRLIAANRLHPVRAVLDAMREASQSQRRSFMIQYLLLSGVNDSERHAEALADALQGIRAKVNLIPFNEHEGVRFRRPEVAAVYAFQQALKGRGLVATVRMSKGRDIQAACGQLIAPPKSP